MPKLVRYLIVLVAAGLGLVIGAILGLLVTAVFLGNGANVGEGAVMILVPVCFTAALVGGLTLGLLARALTRSRAVSTKPSAPSA